MIQKAARIRAEIAALEGKSVQQVQQEALDKKQRETSARIGMAQDRVEKEILYQQQRTEQFGRALNVPNSRLEMIEQAARAVERAVADGKMRQTIRLALLESEDQSIYDANNNMWPGGAAQMSRQAAKPTTQALFRELRLFPKNINNDAAGFQKNTVTVQDVWDFDGSAMVRLLAAPQDNNNNNNEVVVLAQALVFANTDVKYKRDIQALLLEQQKQRQQKGDGREPLLLLVNPFWRDLDSWGINILAPGAKRLAQQVIFNNDDSTNGAGGGLAEETYSCRRFQCRGEECIAIKAYPYDWQIYAYYDEQQYMTTTTIRLGECQDEPKTEFVTQLLNARPEFKLSRTMRQMKQR
jgi:Domain of unknown function (DUF1995)